MKLMKLLVVFGSCLWFSGCIFPPDGRWDDGPRYHYYHHSDDDDGDRGFCPPGQAKKGNC